MNLPSSVNVHVCQKNLKLQDTIKELKVETEQDDRKNYKTQFMGV